MTELDLHQIRLVPGRGIAVVGHHGVVFLAGPDAIPDGYMRQLLELVDAPVGPGDADTVMRGLDGPRGVILAGDDGPVIHRYDGLQVVSTGGPSTDTPTVPLPLDRHHTIGASGDPTAAAPGVWAAAGLEVGAAATPSDRPWWAELDDRPTSIDLAEPARKERDPMPITIASPSDAPPEEGLPIVQGVLCPRGHLVNPVARFCHIDGLSLENISRILTSGPRLPFASLALGSAQHVLTRSAVIGRAPEEDPRVIDGSAIPVAIPDPAAVISRRHALIRVEDWRLSVSDLGSRLGTFVRSGSGAPWIPVGEGEDHELTDGAYIRVGNTELRLARFDIR
ncbi:MAG: FHA domain-containing protein [Acidimicrobiales bacterium]